MVFLWYISSVSFVFLIGRLGNRNYYCSSWRMHFPSFAWYFQLEVQVKSKWVFWFQPWVPCWNSVKLGGFVVWHRPDGYPSIIVGHPAKAKHLLEDLCHCDVGQHDQAPWVVYLVADMFMPANMLTQHVLEDGLVCFLWPAAFVEACEGLPYPDGCKNLSSCLRVIGKEFPNLFFIFWSADV